MTLKPNTPKGTRDFSHNEIEKRKFLKQKLQNAFECYGFSPLETPSFERMDTFKGVYGDDGDQLIFKILNSGDKISKADTQALARNEKQKFVDSISDKALRYDLTVPLARYVAQNQNNLIFPYRRYQIQPVWRADRPQYGRFQEFYQCDADIVGERSLWQEVEVLSLYDTVFSDLCIKGAVLKLNHRKILLGIASLMEVESNLTDLTLILDKFDKIGRSGVLDELKSKNFSKNSIETLDNFLSIKGSLKDQLDKLKELLSTHEAASEGIREMEFIFSQLDKNPLKSVGFNLDLTLARGLHYYTGMIVEVSAPHKVNIGSIGGGGRYDELTANFGLKKMSGIGISFGFERIFMLMEALDLFPKSLLKSPKVLFINFGGSSVGLTYSYVDQLRSKNVSCEFYPVEAKLKKQLSYADLKQIEYVVMIGSNELKEKSFILKHMISGKQSSHDLKDLVKLLT